MGKSAPASYKPMYKPELLEIMDRIRTEVEAVSKIGRTSTPNVCKLLLLKIMDLITGVFQVVEQRNLLATGVLNRSLVEYVIDITFLSLEDNRLLNEQFLNFSRLTKYWQRSWLANGDYADRVDEIEMDYRRYLGSNVFADARGSVYIDKPYSLRGLSTAEKLKRLGDLFPGAQFGQCDAEEIRALDAVSRKTLIEPTDLSYRKSLDEKIKRQYSKHFSGLSTDSRVKKIQGHKNHPISLHLETLLFVFKASSNYTHPTPYAVSDYQLSSENLPCPVPKEDYHWFAAERNLHHYLDLSLLACSDILTRSGIVDIHKTFQELVDGTTYIKPHILAWLGRLTHENSPRN